MTLSAQKRLLLQIAINNFMCARQFNRKQYFYWLSLCLASFECIGRLGVHKNGAQINVRSAHFSARLTFTENNIH